MVLLYVINLLCILLFFCLDLIKIFLKNKEILWRWINIFKIKLFEKFVNFIKIEVLFIYVLNESKDSKYIYFVD